MTERNQNQNLKKKRSLKSLRKNHIEAKNQFPARNQVPKLPGDTHVLGLDLNIWRKGSKTAEKRVNRAQKVENP